MTQHNRLPLSPAAITFKRLRMKITQQAREQKMTWGQKLVQMIYTIAKENGPIVNVYSACSMNADETGHTVIH